MNRHSHKLRILLLSLVCIGVLAGGTYAAYTKSAHHKWVVAAQETPSDLRFSSNYLASCDWKNLSYVSRLVSAGGDTVTIGVTVCNYPQNDLSRVNDSDIAYTLHTQLVKEDGSDASVEGLTIQINDSAFGTSLSGTLTGGVASQNLYRITLSAADLAKLENVYLQIAAIPDALSAAATENKALAARLRILPAAAQATPWAGSFADTVECKSLDAFNYEIQGSAQGKVTLSWDSSKVALSPWSRALLKAGDGNPITFSVGGADQPTGYRLQFYRTCPIPADETWSSVNAYVTADFAPD